MDIVAVSIICNFGSGFANLDLQILANYEEYFDIIFDLIAKLGWAKFRNLNGYCGGHGDLQISKVNLKIFAKYDEYFGITFEFISISGWDT